MIRILFGTMAAVVALVSASCCCTGESGAPPLPPAPQFQEIQAAPAPAPQVHYEK
jgi:hypothetical protein